MKTYEQILEEVRADYQEDPATMNEVLKDFSCDTLEEFAQFVFEEQEQGQ